MPYALLALGTATMTVSGCVWYVPALAVLRAGKDRPVSHQRAAAACLTGWSTLGTAAVLLLLTEVWWIPAAAAVTGLLLAAGLRIHAAALRRNEAREASRHWGELGQGRPLPESDRSRYVVAVLVGTGLVAAAVVAVVRVAAGPGGAAAWFSAVTVPGAVLGLFLTLAAMHARMRRRRLPPDGSRAEGTHRPSSSRDS
ncbi:hypothetical protein ACIP3A_27430 [Streptomyces tricolor]|uniref:hypothetical protein n=1 Tax=Streptomyces TaxID=1883 RepID=UPI000B33C363|nr:hypothetical protein [Streptomyces sp. PBH53]